MKKIKSILLTLVTFLLFGCGSVATTTVSGIDGTLNENVEAENYQGLKRTVAIARFSNETEYAKGAFYDKENDPVGRQAVDILSAKLAATGKFILFEREDLEKVNLEAGLSQKEIQKIGADYFATGHYATILELPNGRYTIKKPSDISKDQTYVLYSLTQEQLAHTIFPLGTLTKSDVRALAENAELVN